MSDQSNKSSDKLPALRPRRRVNFINPAPAEGEMPTGIPRDIASQEFAKRIQARMVGKGWNQSELARRAGIGRDNVSGYIRGITLPGPIMLTRLCSALECEPKDLLPIGAVPKAEDRSPPLDIRESGDGRAWLRINQAVDWPVAVKILALLKEGDPK